MAPTSEVEPSANASAGQRRRLPIGIQTFREIREEGCYASVFYGCLEGAGLGPTVEDSSNRGRLDMAVRLDDNVYLFEFKVVESAPEGAAMAQLKERGYAEKYRHLNRPIHLIALEFSREARNLVAFEVEQG